MRHIRPGRRFCIPKKATCASPDTRFRIARAGLFAFGFLLIVRLFMLQVVDAGTYRLLASEQREVYKDLFPVRGEILLKDGKGDGLIPLATNKDLFLVYADPRLINYPKETAEKLAPLLGIAHGESDQATVNGDLVTKNSIDEYQQLLAHLSKPDDPYEPLKHGLEEAVVDKIRELNLVGIDAVREPVRFYPFKNISSHLAGFVGSDGQTVAGRYGIEGSFNTELAGQPGFFEGERDLGGRWIPVGKRELEKAVDGSNIVLTIDRTIQYTACTKLNQAVASHGAAGGSLIIANASTGAILAMCGAPDFDPNEYSKVDNIAVYNNPGTFAQYEPGSVFKIITMAAALDTGTVTPETTYQDSGKVTIGEYTIQNSDYKAHGTQTMTQVLEKSLNTGAIFAAQQTGVEKFRDYVERFGFGKPTGIELGGEAKGDTSSIYEKGKIYLATASFGQGISTTPIQLLQAIGVIANQGKMMKPYLVSEIRKNNGAAVVTSPEIVREVISPRTAALLSGMMVSVVENGHGKRAGVPGYYVAGKTGTAQISRGGGLGYESSATIGTFVGFAPVENPKFVMVVRIDRPKDVQFAESSAAPLFGEMAKFLLQYFEVKPTRQIP